MTNEVVLQVRMDADLKNAAENLPFPISENKKSVFGALSKYANKNLIPMEDKAWEGAVSENIER